MSACIKSHFIGDALSAILREFSEFANFEACQDIPDLTPLSYSDPQDSLSEFNEKGRIRKVDFGIVCDLE